ncbi:MAG TPA: hypothetical protein VM093_05035 [Aeromicrobium sp.]|nr:hypothetical protein [Aeromicrobium sp.]
MRTRLALLSMLAVPALLAGCGVAPKVTPQPSSSPGEAKPQIGPGTVMTDALTEAHCAADAKGAWSATGVIKNTTKQALAFDVTIYVGPPGGAARTAHVTHVKKIAPGKSAPWVSPVVQTDAPDGPCHIRVRVAK